MKYLENLYSIYNKHLFSDPDHTADPHQDHQLMIIHQEKVEVVPHPIMNKYTVTDIC